jgi:peptide/nickel transport system substrate-binding protein
MGDISAVVSLNPAVTIGNSTAGMNELESIYGSLTELNQTTHQFVPSMAKSLSHNADFTVWTLGLRPGLTFTDGTPYNAAAVIQNLTAQAQPVSITYPDWTLLQSMTSPNPETVVFTFKQGYPEFPFVLSQKNGAIAAPSYLAAYASNPQATPIGAGPFKVQNFQPGVSLTVVPNTNYWAGAPYLSQLKFVWIPGGPATYQAFQTGQLQAALLIDYPSIGQAKSANVASWHEVSESGTTFNINQLPGHPFSDQGLRQAVESAIDQNLQTVNAGLFQNTGTMSPYEWVPGEPYYNKVKVPKESLTQEEAQVKSAETSENWNGSLNLLCSNAPSAANEPTAVEAILKPLGLNFNVSLVATAQEINILNVTHQYDIACFGQGVNTEAPWITMNQFLSSAVAAPRYGYNNPQMDALLNTLRGENSVSAEKATIGKIQQLWFKTVPFIPVAPGDDTTISASNLHGLIHSSQGTTYFDKAWLSS